MTTITVPLSEFLLFANERDKVAPGSRWRRWREVHAQEERERSRRWRWKSKESIKKIEFQENSQLNFVLIVFMSRIDKKIRIEMFIADIPVHIYSMTQFKLLPYNVRIRKINSGDPLQLDDLSGYKKELFERKQKTLKPGEKLILSKEETEELQKNDFYYILQNFLKKKGSTKVFSDSKKTISIDRFEIEGRDIYGTVKSGEYGLSADFYDIESKSHTPNARKTTDSEIFPFFFHFHSSEGSYEGKLILQTVGVFGIATALQRHLNEFLEPLGYSVIFDRLISSDFIDEMGDKRLTEIRLIKKIVPKDIAEKIHDGAPEDLIEERVFRVHKNKTLALANYLKSLFSNKEIDSYEILDEKYSEVKAIITQSGSKRTITFGSGQGKLGELMILNKDIPLDNGHPAFGVLVEHSKDYMAVFTKSEKAKEEGENDSTH